jgi:hypothetical protein
MYTGRFFLAVFLVLTFLPAKISAACSISCDGECQGIMHESRKVAIEVIINHGDCCSEKSEKLPPCCNVKQDTPEDDCFFLLASRVSPPSFFQSGITAFGDQSIIRQTCFYPREHFFLNPAYSAPLYLLNLSLLC